MNGDEASAVIQYVDICENVAADKIDYTKLCKNIHSYIKNYSIDGPRAQWNQLVLLEMFKDIQAILKKDSTIFDTKIPTVIFGPVYGQGDSLINLMSLVGSLPDVNYIMLGCYLGNGFAPIECLALLICLKSLYPTRIFLLKGHLEESLAIEMLDAPKWLAQRGVSPGDITETIVIEMKKLCSLMLPVILLNRKILCMPGGPGPMIRQRGVNKLLKVARPPVKIEDKKILMEAAWSVMVVREDQRNIHGMPSFSQREISTFCQRNKIGCIVRGRQMIEDGFLNKPMEMITLISAAAYLDNFKNRAAVLKIDGDQATIFRYRMEEIEQASLELIKPGIGRNSLY